MARWFWLGKWKVAQERTHPRFKPWKLRCFCILSYFLDSFLLRELEDGLHFSSSVTSRLEMSWSFDFCLESDLTFWDMPFCADRNGTWFRMASLKPELDRLQIKEWQVVVQIHKYKSTCANQRTNVTGGFLNITVVRVIRLYALLFMFVWKPPSYWKFHFKMWWLWIAGTLVDVIGPLTS